VVQHQQMVQVSNGGQPSLPETSSEGVARQGGPTPKCQDAEGALGGPF
jgi:hypothetical protein